MPFGFFFPLLKHRFSRSNIIIFAILWKNNSWFGGKFWSFSIISISSLSISTLCMKSSPFVNTDNFSSWPLIFFRDFPQKKHVEGLSSTELSVLTYSWIFPETTSGSAAKSTSSVTGRSQLSSLGSTFSPGKALQVIPLVPACGFTFSCLKNQNYYYYDNIYH